MAATRTKAFSMAGLQGELWNVTLNGQSSVTVNTGMRRILSATVQEQATFSNPTYKCYVYSITAGVVLVRGSHTGMTDVVVLEVKGYR